MKIYTSLIFLIFVSNLTFCQNIIDGAGKKQGNWLYTRSDTTIRTYIAIMDSSNTASIDTIIEEFTYLSGNYVNGKKNGIWTSYDKSNYFAKPFKFSELTFIDDQLNGEVKIYHENGQIKFSGTTQESSIVVLMKFYSDKKEYWGFQKLEVKDIIEKYSNLKKIKD